MHFYITFCLSVIASSFQAQLLPREISIACLLTGLLLWLPYHARYRLPARILAVIMLGLGYANLIAGQDLLARLPESLEKSDLELTAVVDSLPVNKGKYQQFQARVITVSSHPGETPGLKNVLLNWYGNQPLEPCDIWRLTVRLKRPHGLANPGGFDYEGYLLQRDIQAKGYVRQGELLEKSQGFCLHGLRQQWQRYVEASLPQQTAAWIVALSIGDKSLLSSSQLRLLMETGITHLFVISGSHISLCAAVVYLLLMGLRRAGGGWLYAGDWRPMAWLLALLSAGAYTGIAGFGIPSVRALIMLTVFIGGNIIGIRTSLWLRYWLSMALVLLVNPLSMLDIGFALSFAAVFVLILLTEAVQARKQIMNPIATVLDWLKMLAHAQLYVFVGLLPFTLLYFSQAYLVSPLVNLLAIPWVSILVVPTILLALLVWCISGTDLQLLSIAAIQLDYLFAAIEYLNRQASAMEILKVSVPGNPATMAVLFLASFLLLLPRVFLMRGYAVLLMAAVVMARPPAPVGQGGLVVDVIDVEQGLSVLVQTKNHRLLYDVGSSWPDGSMVEMAVIPYLYHDGISRLDKLVISHLDNDHAGGVEDLLGNMAVSEIMSGEPMESIATTPCVRGVHWNWDGVVFTVLHPEAGAYYKSGNNRSCVLLVEAAGKRVLLPGDIEMRIEQQLATAGLPAIDVLLAPHHGSKSSSGQALVESLEGEKVVIFSSGYLNQFGHPHPVVEQRYREAGARLVNTALQGAIRVEISPEGMMAVSAWREQEGRFWHKLNRRENR